ncbi:serine hydrolase domain-containing protein [Corynebacterium breve]|uniref:Serine hydrolase domain-containing protein n=1 Tax=Corynebacterium breve TaxID=3049799 RepID=A0ABY8VG15_9CORY|nr:serine hydrolase domain-containing protein [Corynebacterium breve]WIM68057.1 serine hydrolase domain-containing protein [Corynebacterium breve]
MLACIALASVVMFIVSPPARLSTTRTGEPEIAELLRKHAGWGHNNLSAFILVDGRVRYGGLGSDQATEFEIASVTKTFNGELLDQAVERGDVAYTTTVADIIGERAVDSELADVTLEELATHTAGLPRLGKTKLRNAVAMVIGANPYVGEDTDYVMDQALRAKLTDRGTENYSNLGHAVLGHLLAENAQLAYPELLQRDILTPLEMHSTYVALPGTVGPEAPRGVWASGRSVEAWEQEGYAPAGALRSTPEDMAKYAQAIVDKHDPNAVWVKEDNGTFWHNGASFGFTNDLIIDPASGTAVYVAGDTGSRVNYLAEDLLKAVQEGGL